MFRIHRLNHPHALDKAKLAQGDEIRNMERQLVEMAGSTGGLDKSQREKAQVVEFLQSFRGKGRSDPENLELTGTKWGLLFTDSESVIRTLQQQIFRGYIKQTMASYRKQGFSGF
jgi:hypothetical protein